MGPGSQENILIRVLPERGRSLYQRPDPVDKSKEPAGENTVQDHGTGNCEDLAADAEYLSLFLIFNSRGGYGVCKSGDRDKSSCAASFRQTGIDSRPGEKYADQDKGQ